MANLFEISQSTDKRSIIDFLQNIKLIHSERSCEKCHIHMKISPRNDIVDGFGWRCSKCRKRLTVRKDTFFENIKISFAFVLRIICHWALQTRQTDQVDLINVDRKSIGMIQQKIRTIVSIALDAGQIKLGGPGKVVEIDESLFIKVKHHKGKDLSRPQVWIFGMYERDPIRENKRCLFVIVPKRDARTLLNVIYQYILHGSVIFSDCWAAYNKIDQLPKDYEHRRVNHDLHFVNPGDGTHTNGIESVWNSAKTHMKVKISKIKIFL